MGESNRGLMDQTPIFSGKDDVTARDPQILVINSGSSSLKFSVLEVRSESVLASGIAERLGTTEALLKFSDAGKKKNRNHFQARITARHSAG
jgi:acetate kinase